ncbi:chloride channel protein [Martelella endophytica]|uniref:Chloride channel protein n=1 Tax=Martelella endophytica TaxID=1486262 RepID=A0A0D5LKA5_MAREN|nr:chloride channel protein [Martelella endophytica]AJY44581.1 chloride channel protein [Martelella endophytica]
MRPYYKNVKMFRRSRVMWGSWRIWQPRLVFWVGAVMIGVISVLFARAADEAMDIFNHVRTANAYTPYLPLIITPLGFMLCSYLGNRWFPNSQGSGIPQAIAARHLHHTESQHRLLNLRIAAGKILITVLGLFCGASIGREGPTAQVGASIMIQTARWGKMIQTKGLIVAGSAAGISAAFNTPLAGIVFAIEEMSRAYESRANGLVVSAIILSGLAAIGLAGNYTYFGQASAIAVAPQEWVAVFVCGIGGGLLGALFSLYSLKAARRLKRWAQPAPIKRMALVAGGCGLAVAVIGVISGGSTFGTGYEQARTVIEGGDIGAFYFVGKLAATFLSMASGIPGGLFAPSLSVGATLGSSIAHVLGISIGLGAILGMAGYFAGVVQSPMTAFVIILEMTDNHDGIITLMATSMLGYIASRLILSEPLYHGLSRAYLADAIKFQRARSRESAEEERANIDEMRVETKRYNDKGAL